MSDTRENQNKILGGVSSSERASTLASIKKMKADLTVTNFKLGDESPIYETTTRMANQAVKDRDLVNSLNSRSSDVKNLIKKSSLHFGNETVDYTSVSKSAMEYKGTVH